ncbi:MAG: Dabb family protein [Actinomycetota bacterium]|nr:Dabb family protein [Actinomycetota bacterium]
MTVQHIVLFAFAEDLDAADELDMRSQVESWPQEIGQINMIRFGKDITGARTRGHQYLLSTEFDSEELLHRYQQHPIHQKFLAWVLDHDCVPLAFDYELTHETVIWPSTTPDPLEEH